MTRSAVENLPRHHCRGLIEAVRRAKPWRSPGRIFRGITAAASLKRLDDRLRRVIGRVIFRGITAAASLKLASTVGLHTPIKRSSAASLPRPH